MRTKLVGAVVWALCLGAGLVISGCSQAGTHVGPGAANTGDPARGNQLIKSYGCGSCHTVPGVRDANGLVGPPLTDYGARSYIAGKLPNNFPNLVRWIMNPQAVVPGNAMPDLGVKKVDAQDIAAYLESLGGSAGQGPAPYPSRAPYTAHSSYAGIPPPGSPDRSRALYLRTCSYCHGSNGEGSQFAPSLRNASAAKVDYYLRSGRMPLRNLQVPVPQQAPPGPPQFGNADILALDQYVSSLGGSGASTTLPKVQRGNLLDGRALYEENCAACHAPSGIGYTQVSGYVAPFVLFSSPQTTADAIRVGPRLMPQFPKSVFDQRELNDLVTYVQYLRRPQVGAHGGASIGRIGAAIEALVAFAAVAFLMLVIRLLGKRSAEGQQP